MTIQEAGSWLAGFASVIAVVIILAYGSQLFSPTFNCMNEVTQNAIKESPWPVSSASSCSGACYHLAQKYNVSFECVCPWSDNSRCVREWMTPHGADESQRGKV